MSYIKRLTHFFLLTYCLVLCTILLACYHPQIWNFRVDGFPSVSRLTTHSNINMSFGFRELHIDNDTRFSESVLNLLDHEVTAPLSLVAILPVTTTSSHSLRLTLASLLEAPGNLEEIIFLCPSALHQAIQLELQRILPIDTSFSVDISISTWPYRLREDSATLLLARQVSAERVLVLDSTGLVHFDSTTRNILLRSLLPPLPVGPRGVIQTENTLECVTASSKKPVSVAYLVPPFSISTSLMPPHDLDPAPVHGIWSALGHYISRSCSKHVGGIIMPRETSEFWCSHLPISVENPTSTLELVHVPPTHQLHGPDPSNISTTPVRVLLFFSGIQDLQSFSPAICRMLAGAYDISVFLAADEPASSDQTPLGTKSLNTDLQCSILYNMIEENTLDGLSETFRSISIVPDVVVTVLEDSLSGIVEYVLRRSNIEATFLKIPRKDLRYCDWMSSLSSEEWRNWYAPQLFITVITNDRPKSLMRLLNSITAASFFGDVVSLHVNVEQTADEDTLNIVNNLTWNHGPAIIHRRVIHGGLLPAIAESWYPSSNHSYGLILEDDVELSPLFYAWIKMALLRYRYGHPQDQSSLLFGISLYQQKNLELRPEGRHRFNAQNLFAASSIPNPDTPYLSQIPCSWGAVYFPEQWREFHEYLSIRLSAIHPQLPIDIIIAPGLRSNTWIRSWKKYFIELAYLRGYVMLYPNYKGYMSLSTNHLEVGSHVRELSPGAYARKKRLFQLPLMPLPNSNVAGTGLLALPENKLPARNTLPVVDLLGLLSTQEALRDQGLASAEKLTGCRPSLDTSTIRSLICLDS